jgi:hypothetical protein
VHQSDDLCAHNELKLTYEHLQVKKFFRGQSPRNPRAQREGQGVGDILRRGGQGRGGEGAEERGREGARERGGEGAGKREGGERREGDERHSTGLPL